MSDAAVSIAPTYRELFRVVWTFIAMMLLQIPLSLIYSLFLLPVETSPLQLGVSIAAAVMSVVSVVLLARGYGWVRHFFLAGAILNFPRLILFLSALFHYSLWHGIALLSMHLWFFAALALLYFRSARTWFRDARMRRQGGL